MLGFKGVNGIIYKKILSWDISGNIKDGGKLLVKTSKADIRKLGQQTGDSPGSPFCQL